MVWFVYMFCIMVYMVLSGFRISKVNYVEYFIFICWSGIVFEVDLVDGMGFWRCVIFDGGFCVVVGCSIFDVGEEFVCWGDFVVGCVGDLSDVEGVFEDGNSFLRVE